MHSVFNLEDSGVLFEYFRTNCVHHKSNSRTDRMQYSAEKSWKFPTPQILKDNM